MSRETSWDITLDGEGYTLYRAPNKPANLGGQFRSATPGGGGPGAEVVRLFEDYSGGMGYSRRMIPNGYELGSNFCSRLPYIAIPGPKVTQINLGVTLPFSFTESFEFDAGTGQDNLYICMGQYAFRLSNGQEPATIVNDFGSGNQVWGTLVHPTNGKAYVSGLGAGTDYMWQISSTGVWTKSSDSSHPQLATVYWTIGGGIAGTTGNAGTGRTVIVGTDAQRKSFQWMDANNTSDPMTAAHWIPSTAVKVGTSNYSIQAMIATNRTVTFVKTDGVHPVDGTGYSPNLTPYWGAFINQHFTGKASAYWNGYLYAWHTNYLDRVPLDWSRQDKPEICGPGQLPHPNESAARGFGTAIGVIDGWLATWVWNPDDNISRLFYARERQQGEDGFGPLVWHGSEIDMPGRVLWFRSCGSFDPSDPFYVQDSFRMLIATWTGTAMELYWAPVPRGGNPLNDSTFRFASSGWVQTGKDDGGKDNSWTKKATRRYDVYADGLENASGIVTVSAAMDDTATFTEQGTAGGASRTSFISDELTGTMVNLKVDLTGTDTNPPILRSLALHEILLPEQNARRVYEIMLGSSGQFVGQSDDRESPAEKWAILGALQESEDVTMIDELGQELTVKVLPGITYTEKPAPDGQGFVLVATVVVDEIMSAWYWDDGSTFDSNRYWG